MARILGNPFGELRGKAGGSVFSRNRAGEFMRVYVKPAQANSVAQLTARASFGSASQLYRTRTPLTQQTWKDFALTTYNPLRRTNVGQYTGQQAFIAINQSAQMSQAKTLNTTWKLLGGGATQANTSNAYSCPSSAPGTTCIPQVFAASGGGTLPLLTDFLTFSLTTGLKVNLNFGATGIGKLAGQLTDANNKAFGVGFYMSDPVSFNNQRVKNKWYAFLGNTNQPTFTTPLVAGLLGLEMNCALPSITGYKSFPTAGQWVLMTAVQVGIDGTQATIGSQYIQVTA